MFERPFADFDPGPHDIEAGAWGAEVLLHGLSHTAEADEQAPESPER